MSYMLRCLVCWGCLICWGSLICWRCLICWESRQWWWWWWKFYGMKKILFLFCHNISCHILNWIQRLWKSYFKRVLLSPNSIIHFTIEFFSTNFYWIQYILFNVLFVEDSFIINFALKHFYHQPVYLPNTLCQNVCGEFIIYFCINTNIT